MREPTLVVLAAGMGSRFGGLKQITPVDDRGQVIMDYSLYDARRAGFRKVAFVIKHEIEDDFREKIGRRMERFFDVTYVFQQLDCLPAGYAVPEGRVKPWGTGHAVACLQGQVAGPFAVINADDFYGAAAYEVLYRFLAKEQSENSHAMVAFPLQNTLSPNGTVSRGICQVENGKLVTVTERTRIRREGEDAAFTEDGETWTPLAGSSPVSMNFWGFGPGMLGALNNRLPAFLDRALAENPLKGEYALPTVVDEEIRSGNATVEVLSSTDSWFGVTYPEDLPTVKEAIAALKKQGAYPQDLWN